MHIDIRTAVNMGNKSSKVKKKDEENTDKITKNNNNLYQTNLFKIII